MSLKNKFRIIEAIAAAGLLTLGSFWIHGEYSRILRDKEEKVRHLVEVPYSIPDTAAAIGSRGKLSRGRSATPRPCDYRDHALTTAAIISG